MCQISRKDIENYIHEVAKEHSNVTANRSLSVFKKVFAHAQTLNVAAGDPSDQVTFLSEKEHERNRFLLPKNLDQLIEIAKTIRGEGSITCRP